MLCPMALTPFSFPFVPFQCASRSYKPVRNVLDILLSSFRLSLRASRVSKEMARAIQIPNGKIKESSNGDSLCCLLE